MNVSPGAVIGAGFGELTPDRKDLRITVHAPSGWMFYNDVMAGDSTGGTSWTLESSTSTSRTFVAYGAQEDEMGRTTVSGTLFQPPDPFWMGQSFQLHVSNALWPCKPCEYDPQTGMPVDPGNCTLGYVCDTTEEGELKIAPGGEQVVGVTIHHGLPGTLTILGASSDLEVLNPDESPFTSQWLSGSGVDAVQLLLRASSEFSGQVELTCRFLQDGAELDSQDVLHVEQGPSIHALTGIEVNTHGGGGASSNSVTVFDRSDETLYICCDCNPVRLIVAPPAAGTLPPPEQILFKIDGTGATPATGNFGAGNPEISFQAGIFYTVNVGIDINVDGTLQPAEITHSFYVRVVSFTGASVHSARTSAPAESLFPVQHKEHCEVGGTFRYELVPGAGSVFGPQSLIRYKLKDQTFFVGQSVTSGAGTSFSWTWGPEHADTWYRVTFWCDRDDNGSFLPEVDTVHIHSPEFWVMEKTQLTYTVHISSLSGATLAGVQGDMDTGATRMLRRDSENDWRACVEISATDGTIFDPDPETAPDPAPTQPERNLHYANPQDMTILSSLGDELAGQASGTKMLISWTLRSNTTIVHEIGHVRGLGHNEISDRYIMWFQGNPNRDHLTQAEAKAYDGGP